MAITVNVNGNNNGRVFAGIGGVTSNGMTKLLREYPETQRNDILDLLFKPKWGASFHLLKIEIGSDANGTCGTEPSHMRSKNDFDITRGSGLWLGAEAKKRNKSILLDAIRWGTPGWINDDDDKYLYYYNFLRGARETFNLEFDYLSPDENEGAFSRNYTVNKLRPGLNQSEFSGIKLAACDSTTDWNIAAMVTDDPGLKNALAAINAHYRQDSPENAKDSGLPIYDSEDLAPNRHSFASCLNVAYRIIRSYASGKMVMYQMHPVIEAIYDNVPYTYKGVIAAAHPWSGHYEIDNGLWVTAHFTQFIEPGWVYLDSGCSSGADNSYLTLKNPGTDDVTIIILNRGVSDTEYIFNLNNLNVNNLYAWGTDEENQFYQMAGIPAASGGFAITVPPKTIYTLSTTSGQRKGEPADGIPGDTALALPYLDNFDGYEPGGQPRYTVDQSGAFEISSDGLSGNCLKQLITRDIKPLDWERRASPSPYTLLGDQNWKNYQISADILMEPIEEGGYEGYALLGARCNFSPTGNVPAECYNVRIFSDGRWQLRKAALVLASGTLDYFQINAWYKVQLTVLDYKIIFSFDGKDIITVSDYELPSGHAVIGSGYNKIRFDNLVIEQADGNTPVNCLRYQETDDRINYMGSWAASGSNAKNYNRNLLVSNKAGDKMEFSFNGTAVSILGVLDTNCGRAEVYVDDTLQAAVDAYSGEAKYRKSLFSAYNLSPENHTVRLVVLGEKNGGSSDTYINIDAVETCGGTGLIEWEYNPMPVDTADPYTLFAENFENMAPGQAPSGWTVNTPNNTGCAVETLAGTKCLRIVDDSTDVAASAIKTFDAEASYLSVEFNYRAEQTGRWFRAFILDGSTSVIEIYDSNENGLCYRNHSAADIKIMDINPNRWYALRLDIDIAGNLFNVYVDGDLKHENGTFRRAGARIDGIRFESGGGFTGTAYFDDITIAVNDLVSDTFNNIPAGSMPLGWGVTIRNNTSCTVENIPSESDRSMTLVDNNNSRNVIAEKPFPGQAKRIVTTYTFRDSAPGTWTRAILGDNSDQAVVLFNSDKQGFCYRDSFGRDIKLMDMAANTWYEVMIVADASIDRFDIYVNGILIKAGCGFRSMAAKINRITFATGESYTGTLNINDVSIKRGKSENQR
jgi:galactosylceramidase